MAKKPSVTTVSSGFASNTQLNANFTALRDAFDNTLSLDGSSPNAMGADIDLNGNDLLNVGTIDADVLVVAGTNLNTQVANAAASATASAASATASAASATAASLYAPAYFSDVAALLADTRAWPTGQILNTREEGFAYEVAAPGASDHHVTTAGGKKLYVQPGQGKTYDVRAFGAKLDGSDDTVAFQKAVDAATDGSCVLISGRISVSTGIVVSKDGVAIEGYAPGYGNSGFGSEILARSDFAGTDYILKFAKLSGAIRSPAVRNLSIDGGSASDADGLVVMAGYDGAIFENITVTRIANGRRNFVFDAPLGSVGQTIIAKNLFGLHRSAANTAPAFYIRRQQECTFENCKGWSGSQTADYTTNSGNPWYIESCNGCVFTACSAVSTLGTGFDLVAGDRGLNGITIDAPTIESVQRPITIRSTAYLLFGAMTGTVAIGSEVRQPADGSGAVGYAYLSTLLGVYVVATSGAFTTGTVFDGSGVSFGNITSVRQDVPDGIRITNPRIMGTLGSGPLTSTVSHATNTEIEWDVANNSLTDYPLEIARGVEARVIAGKNHTITNRGLLTTSVTVSGISGLVRNAAYYTEYGVTQINLPAPKEGAVVTITSDAPNATAAQINISLGSGVTILRDGVSLSGPLRLNGSNSSVTLVGISSTQWVVTYVFGGVSLDAIGLLGADGGITVATTASSRAIGVQHRNFTWTNSGRGASATTFNLVTALSSLVGLTITFCRTDAGTVTIDPSGTEEILGGTGAGKFITLAASGSVTLRVVAAGKWQIISAYGVIIWEP